MEKALLLLFLILFAGRLIWRYVLEQLNIRHLQSRGKEIPRVFQGIIDQRTLSKMVDYTVENSRLGSKENLVDDIIELAILFLLVPVFVSALVGLKIHFIWQALIFFGVFAAIGCIVGIPFDLYDNFVLEKKYGFSTITWRIWITDLIKSLIISAILMTIMVSAFMSFINYLPTSWWFWAWIFFTLLEIVLLWLYPVLIAPLFNKYEPIKDELLKERSTL